MIDGVKFLIDNCEIISLTQNDNGKYKIHFKYCIHLAQRIPTHFFKKYLRKQINMIN